MHLQYTINMCLKLKEEVTNPPTQVNLIDDDYGIILELFSFVNIKKMMFWNLFIFLKEN
jgi:hypothetical protein